MQGMCLGFCVGYKEGDFIRDKGNIRAEEYTCNESL